MNWSVRITVLCCFLLFPSLATAKGFDFNELYANKANPYYRLYDFIFPALASARYVKPDMHPVEKLDAALNFVTFYSTPGQFARYQGLGTGMGWKEGATVLMRSGNLLCSEQSSLAAMMLRPHFPNVAIRDVQSHTFHEVEINGRKVIVDPYADNHLRTIDNSPVTFDDIQKWLNGDSDRLRLPHPLTARLKGYLDRFRSENYNSPRLPFGKTMAIPDPGYQFMVGMPVNVALYSFKQRGHNIHDPAFDGYRYYVRNNVYDYLQSKGFSEQAIWNVQDFFFSLLRQDVQRGALRADLADDLYFARGYQMLGRYNEALKVYRNMTPSHQVDFFMAQCHFKLGDHTAFLDLADSLGSNIFYRVMYYRLTGEYLRDTDHKSFDALLYRDVRRAR